MPEFHSTEYAFVVIFSLRKLRIVTYMSPLGDVLPTATRYVSTLTHPEARWPLFYYEVQLHQFLTEGGGGGATSASCFSATTSADNKEDMMDNEDEC